MKLINLALVFTISAPMAAYSVELLDEQSTEKSASDKTTLVTVAKEKNRKRSELDKEQFFSSLLIYPSDRCDKWPICK